MNNLPEGFLENRLQELLADDDLDTLRSGFTPSMSPHTQPKIGFDQVSARRVAQPKHAQPDPPRMQNPTSNNLDQPSSRRTPVDAASNFNQPTRSPQRPAAPGLPDQMHPSSTIRSGFDQQAGLNQERRGGIDSPSRKQQTVLATQRMPQNQESNKMNWSDSLLNSISAYDERAQPNTAELLQGALEALTDAVIITDGYGRLSWVNRFASELLDMPASSLVGTPATAVFGQYAAAFVPAELLLLAPGGRLNDWQITLLLPSAVRRSMVFNFALTRRNGEQVVVAIGREYREAPAPAAPGAQTTSTPTAKTARPIANAVERVTVRLRPDAEPPIPMTVFTTATETPKFNELDMPSPPTVATAASSLTDSANAAVATNAASEPTPIISELITEVTSAVESGRNAAIPELATYSLTPTLTELPTPEATSSATVIQAPTPASNQPLSSLVPDVIPPMPVSNTEVESPINLMETTVAVSENNASEEAITSTEAPSEAPATSDILETAEATAAQFWQFLEYAPEPMIVTDHRGRIVQLNTLAEQLFGYDRVEMLGEKALALLAKRSRNAERPRFPFGINDVQSNSVSETVEIYGWHRNGDEFPIQLTRRQTDDGQYVVSNLRPLTPSSDLPISTPTEEFALQLPDPLPDDYPDAHGVMIEATPSLIITFNEHLRRHNRALGELSRSTALKQNGLVGALAEITAVAAQALDTARVSIWLFNEARTEIICQDLFEAVDECHSQGMRLVAAEFPRYFAALAEDRTIAAHHAHTDERTAEFSESYLKPNNISSKLDAPIRALGRQIGVVCHEHIGASRQWTPEEEAFAASVADFVAMAYEAQERQIAQASQARLAAVLQATPDCVSITDAQGRLLFLNEAGRRLVERTQGENIADLLVSDLYSQEAYAQMESIILPAALQQGVWTGETTLRRADGSEIPVAQVTFVQKDTHGTVEFIAHIHHDITLRKQMEEERLAVLAHEQQLRRSAEENIQHKDDFLSTLSHELRTPLTGIVGWIELIRSGTLNEEELARALATIERDAQTQMRLVDDLLDASRVISDKLTLEAQPVELMNVVAAALDTVRPQIEEKDIKLNVSFQPWVGPFVGDASRLQQVVWNLLSNAVKFTPAGGTIEVALARNQSQALIMVRDNGLGITPEFMPHLFERFRQQDGSTIRRHGGLGLGLAIAKHIVELHHGTITAHSGGVKQGTEFVITLPLATNEPAPAFAPKAANLQEKLQKPLLKRPPLLAGVRVLAVDDQPGARDLFRTILTQYQAEVRLAATASEARQLLASWQPHILISDIGMPGEDGCEMIRTIRTYPPEQGGHIPAIAITAYVSEQDRARALQAGFNTHLAKPVNPEELVNALTQLTNPLRQAVERLSNSGSLNESTQPSPLQ